MIIIPANTISGGYEVANSLRFNRGSSDYLSSTFGSTGNRKTFTLSFWIKRASIGSDERIIEADTGTDGNNVSAIEFDTVSGSNRIRVIFYNSPTVNLNLKTNALFSDLSAWYHIVLAIDTTQATASNRAKFYVNGTQVTSFETATYPSQNLDTDWNLSGNNIRIGRRIDSSPEYYSGYMSEVILVDGQALTPTSFGEFDEDTNIWKPIDVSGLTFGTNGFYLDFENSSSLGADVSGNGNNFTVNNLTSIDQSTDTCTNNFATLNPLASVNDAPNFSDGNLTIDISNAGKFGAESTIGVSQGKWYAEFKLVASSDNDMAVGVNSDKDSAVNDTPCGFGSNSIGYRETGTLAVNGSDDISYGNSYTVNDIVGIALDLDNNKIYFTKNGTWQNSGDPTSGATGTGAKSLTASSSTELGAYFFNPSCHSGSQNGDWSANFGSPPYAISSGNSDGNGYGNFEYAVPSGYYALNSKNLAEYG